MGLLIRNKIVILPLIVGIVLLLIGFLILSLNFNSRNENNLLNIAKSINSDFTDQNNSLITNNIITNYQPHNKIKILIKI